MKIAAIDIGSNAARLRIFDVIVNKQKVAEFNKISFLRLPLRLGFDVFETGRISEKGIQNIINAMQVFKSLVHFYEVKPLKVCATSAMRDAKNAKEVVESVEKETGIKIEIISGDEEATLIHENHIADNMDREHGYLYVNVGGGSTDLIFFEEGKVKYKKSIDIGTIRILKNQVNEKEWESMKSILRDNIKSLLPVVAIGSGGNINKVFDLSKKKEGKPLSLDILKNYYNLFRSLTIEERMHEFGLREDRADVIVPALEIYIKLMTWAKIDKIYVPKIGLVDGLAHALYAEIVNTG